MFYIKNLLMKKVFYYLALILSVLLNSCSQDVEKAFSCDKTVNRWVIDNLVTIHEMTRSEWNQLDESKKHAAYGAFTQQQRIKFWHEKLEELKLLDWSAQELTHIALIGEFIDEHPEFFSGKSLTEEQSDELYLFCYPWVQTGIKKFGWTEKTAASIIATGNVVTDKSGGIQTVGLEKLHGTKEANNCHCHAGNIITTCYLDHTSCEENGCTEPLVDTCGFLLQESCNGQCI